jgi:hypothetical protein
MVLERTKPARQCNRDTPRNNVLSPLLTAESTRGRIFPLWVSSS